MFTVKLQALPVKSHVTVPRPSSPWECFGSQVTAAKGECLEPLNNRNPCAEERKTTGPPAWGLGVGPITSPNKKNS